MCPKSPTPTAEAPDLRRLVRTMHRVLRDYEGNSSLLERFDELTKILYCKVMDERESESDPERSVFNHCAKDADETTSRRVRQKFSSLVNRRPDLFPERFTHLHLGNPATRRLAEEVVRGKARWGIRRPEGVGL